MSKLFKTLLLLVLLVAVAAGVYALTRGGKGGDADAKLVTVEKGSITEKALAVDLQNWDVPYFLPMVQRTLVIRGRRFHGMLPLFPGYLFFVGDVEDRYRALTTSHIANVINVVDQAQLVDELSQIELALATPSGLDPFPFLQKGKRCRIARGPLAGIQGVVVRRAGVTRLVLQIEMLGQAVATEIDPSMLEPDE